ncbi:general vesicular transport factor p115 isoform X1 [Hydra vulgaris]|uniref:general vesicular transport factor p115 isoform X1 n=1 Tax=Hydra vulgaris TaxID=6087 RepID=UPI001F5FB277|nr:general vesicular transport factor p115-like [Hydra vulgaris]
MEYLSRGFKSVLGKVENEGPSGAETVDRLVDRISSATLLDDRRDAVRAIKSLSKKFRVEVGTSAMNVLIKVLHNDRTDSEICGLALEALVTIMSNDVDEQSEVLNNDLPVQFTEIFLKDSDNVTCLLGLLEEYEFRIRWATVRLLIALLNNRTIQIQQCVLVSPLGVSRLMDLLSDSREVIRNDGLTLLILLTKGNAAIQKIVAFENAFDRLLEVISDEGYSNGGVITEDCLILMSNLFNASNINFFREGSYIPRLVPFFDFSDYTEEGRTWSELKMKNVLLMLQLIRTLVSPNNPPQSTQSSQKVIYHCNLLKILCDLLMKTGIPAEILTETVNTVAEIIRGNQTNQAFFSVVDAPYTPPKPAIVVLLMSMISDKQPFSLRCAVLYCFQCYLYKNPTGQSRVISTLLPSGVAEANHITAGQLLCGGLFSNDSFSNWCAAMALSHALFRNKDLKEQLLRVQLATGVGYQPVSLLQQCSNILLNGGSSSQTRIAILSLLCSWLTNCPIAVAHFLSNSAIIPFLFSCIEQPCEMHESVIQGLSAVLVGVCIIYNDGNNEKFTSDSIKRLITTRLDPEHFLTKINDVSKSELFTTAAKHTQIQEVKSDRVLFDHEFTKQFKKLEVSISKSISEDDDADDKFKTSQTNESVVMSYKVLIREQDVELGKLRTQCKELQENFNDAQRQLERQAIELVQIRNQVAIMKEYDPDSQKDTVHSLQNQIQEKEELIKKLQQELTHYSAHSLPANVAAPLHNGHVESESEDLSIKVSLLEAENSNLKQQMEKLQLSLSIMQASLEAITTNKQAAEENSVTLLNKQIASLVEENNLLKTECARKETTPNNNEIQDLRLKLEAKTSDYAQQRQDYEDLLVLLEDQDAKIKKYKIRLRELGDTTAGDSSDDDDDETIDSGINMLMPDSTKNHKSLNVDLSDEE